MSRRRALASLTLLLAAAGQYGLGTYGWAPAAWLAALLLFGWQLLSAPVRLPETDASLPAPYELAALFVVLALAAFFRTYRLDLIPSGLNHDVAWNGLYGLRILQGEAYTPYTAEAWGRETTMLYLQALGIRLFGVETPALIYPAVAIGIALVPIFYLWLRQLFGSRLALGATFLLAVSGWHLVFSRIGWRAVLQPLVSTLAYWLAARAARTQRTLAFCGAGAAAAAAIYTYNAARLLPLLFPLFALCALALAPKPRQLFERYRRGAVDMSVSFALVVFPMAYFAATHWRVWEERANATYFLDGHTVLGNLAALGNLYLLSANGDDFFVSTPVLEWPVAIFFVFGILWCLSQWRDLRAVFLLLGWAVAAMPAFLSTPNANRMIGTLPFAYTFAGLGVWFFCTRLAGIPASISAAPREPSVVSGWDPSGARVASGIAVLVGIAATMATWAQYFGPNRRELPGFYPEATIVGRYARSLLPRFDVWIGGRNFPRETLDYLTYLGGDPRRSAYTWLDDPTQAVSMVIAPQGGKGAALILATAGRSGIVLEQLRRRYADAEIVDLHDWTRNDEVFARAVLLPPAVLAAPPPVADVRALPVVYLQEAKRGDRPGQFLDPRGAAVGADGVVYVADSGNHRVQVFGPDGRLTAMFGEHGATPGTFAEPSAVAIDDQGKLHVVDTWNHRIQKLEPDGVPLTFYTPPQGFFGPRGIAIVAGQVYVTDTGDHSIELFDIDGLYRGSLGNGEGSGPGQLESPIGIAVTADGEIWVVDAGNRRLQVFASNGDLVRMIPVPTWSGTELREGYLVADGDAVILSDPDTGKLWRVTPDATFTEIAAGLRFPGGMALGPRGIYVAERAAGSVSILKR